MISFEKAKQDIVFERFDNDLVILDLGSGRYFGVNAAGGQVWEHLLAGGAVETIQTGQSRSDLDGFVSQLVEFKLIIRGEADANEAICIIDTTPTIEAYDDLSDLILADPIHDVDAEAGWPKAPN